MIAVISQVSGKPITKKPNVKPTSRPEEAGASPHDNWIMWLTYAVLIAVPIIFFRPSYDQFGLIKLATFEVLALGMAFVWSAKLLTRREPVRLSWREGLLAAFLLLAVISTFTSIDVQTSVHGLYKRYEGLFTFITYATVYFIVAQTLKGKGRLRTLIEVISITGAVVALYGIVQYLGLDPINWGRVSFEQRRSFSTLGNPDLLAAYLVLAFPCAIVSYWGAGKRAWLHGAAAVILASGLLTSLTRGGWFGALVAAVCLAFLSGRRLSLYGKKSLVLIAPVALVLAALVIYSSASQLDVVSKVQGAFELNGGTALERFETWKAGWLMIKERPLLGQGMDTYRLASEHFETRKYVRSVEGATVSDNAHNYFIHLAAGAGLPAALLIYAFFIACIVRMIRVRRGLMDEEERLLLGGVIAAVIGYLVTMLVGISVVGSASTFWILLAAGAGFSKALDPAYPSFDFSRLSRGIRAAVVAALMVVSVAVAGFALAMFASDAFFFKGLTAIAAGDESPSVSNLNTAATLYPANGLIMSDLGQAYLRWAGVARQKKDEAVTDYCIQQAIKAFERARSAEPREVDYRLFLANAYAYAGEKDKAMNTLRPVLEQRPYSVPGHYLYARFMEASGRKAEAIRSYQFTLSLAPSHEDALIGLIGLYTALGDQTKAAEYQRRRAKLQAGAE